MSSVKVEEAITPPILAWLKKEFPDVPRIIERPNVPRPKTPYFAIFMTTPLTKVGMSDSVEFISSLPVPGATSYNIGGQRQFTMAIRCYGNPEDKQYYDAQNKLVQLQDSLEDEVRRVDLTSAGLSVWFSTDILDIAELLETGFEPRAQFDIIFGIASNRAADLGAIEKTEITGTYDGQEEPEFSVPED